MNCLKRFGPLPLFSLLIAVIWKNNQHDTEVQISQWCSYSSYSFVYELLHIYTHRRVSWGFNGLTYYPWPLPSRPQAVPFLNLEKHCIQVRHPPCVEPFPPSENVLLKLFWRLVPSQTPYLDYFCCSLSTSSTLHVA